MKKLSEKQRQFQIRRNKKRFPKEVIRAKKRRILKHKMKLLASQYRRALKRARAGL